MRRVSSVIDRERVRGRAASLEQLAATAQGVLTTDAWRPGAHGEHATPKADDDRTRHRLTLSRSCSCEPGTDRVASEAAAMREALAAAGCDVDERAFGGGDQVWIVASRGDDEVVVKLASNGNRLITAQSRTFDDATADEAAAALAD